MISKAGWLLVRIAALGLALTAAAGALAQTVPRLDDAFATLLAQSPSDADLGKLKDAINAINNGDSDGAGAAQSAIADPVTRKLARWWELRSGKQANTPEEIEDFVVKNPDWPNITLRARAEEALLTGGDAEHIRAFFKVVKPETSAGVAAEAVALLAKGNTTQAAALAADAWRNGELSDAAETAMFGRLGNVLTPADHAFRAGRLLFADTAFDNIRSLRIAAIKRLMPLMAHADKARIEARLAVYRCRHKGCYAPARVLFAHLPPAANQDPGVIFDKARMLRKSGATQQAWRLMLEAGPFPANVQAPDDWWIEKRISAYGALYDGDHQAAYRLAAEHGALGINPLKEAEFLSGWIALRFLKDPKRALTHFKAMRRAADGPISLAQADYWLGRTFSQMGDERSAKPAYTEAAGYFNTYYGQIARQTLDKAATSLNVAAIPLPPAVLTRKFVADEAVRAAVIAGKAGLIDVMRVLLNNQKDRAGDEASSVLAAHLAIKLGDTQMALKIGKAAMEKGWNGLTRYAYPTVAMPAFQPLRTLPEKALLYAIARQESEFNTIIKSSAGARGILQILPGTAKGVCGKYKVRCEVGKLISDPGYNAKLASAYVADTTDEFAGSYIMAIAGYNAGPGRVRDWVSKVGDPREAGTDPIDWVEMLSIDETRDYVKKVLSNVQVYRAELEAPGSALRIRADLQRGRAGGSTAAANN